MAQAATEEGHRNLSNAPSVGRRVAGALVRRREASIALVALGLILYFSFRTEAFFGADNAQLIAEFSAPIAIIAAGEVMLLICGEIDLSAGKVYAFSTWIFYFGVTDWGLPIWLAVIVGLLSGSLVGARQRNDHRRRGSALVHHDTRDDLRAERDDPHHLGRVPGRDSRGAHVLRVLRRLAYVTVYWALGVIVVMTILLNRTRWGLHTVATGGNLIGASESGVNVRKVKVGNFVLCSTLAALAGILESVRITRSRPSRAGRRSCSTPSPQP